jgi:6-phosphofructokinase 1
VSIREAGLDVLSMARTSTKVFVLEVMGRHAGWIAASAGLAGRKAGEPPHIILFPEIAFDEAAFLARAKETVDRYGYCVVAVSEGVHNAEGKFLADMGTTDAFGHSQLGGVGQVVAELIKRAHGYKFHWALADYLQRSARHIASRVDAQQAYAVGKAAVELAVAGENAVMPIIERVSQKPYRWRVGSAKLEKIANREKKMPRNYITPDGFGITAKARTYLGPLMRGEDFPPFRDGLPRYVRLKNTLVAKKLSTEFKV